MKPIYKKYFAKTALIWAGCFVLFLFAYMLLLAPQKKSRKIINQQFAETEKLYNSALEAAKEETRLRLNQQLEHLRNSLEAFVVDFEKSTNLTFDIRQIAKDKDVDASFSVKTRDSQEIPNCDHISEDRLYINFTAGFNQFAAFLNALERHRPVVFVDKFAITRSDKPDSAHEVNMDLAVFVRKPQDS